MKKFLLIFFIFPTFLYSYPEGYDYYLTSNYVEFDENCFHEGDDLYMYDYSTSSYHMIEIYDMDGYDDGDEIEIYDYTFGRYRYIDLEDDVC